LRCTFATVGALSLRSGRAALVTPHASVHYGQNLSRVGLAAIMDAFIKRVVADFGVDQPTVEKALGIILDFLAKEGPADKVQPLLAKLPGAQALMQKAASESDAGMGGVMGAGMRMMASGLSMGQVQDITRQFIAYAREKVGEDEIGGLVGAIPGLAQFV
jgi:hypothetical protein